jgi:hypothetical protein
LVIAHLCKVDAERQRLPQLGRLALGPAAERIVYATSIVPWMAATSSVASARLPQTAAVLEELPLDPIDVDSRQARTGFREERRRRASM